MFKKGIALVLAIVMIAALCISASAMELTVDTLDAYAAPKVQLDRG